MSVEKQVSRSLPEVWRVFSTEVHEQRALSGHKQGIHRQTTEMLADMKPRGTEPTRHPGEIENMTTKAKRQCLSSVKKRRRARRGTLYPHLVGGSHKKVSRFPLNVTKVLCIRRYRNHIMASG